MRASSGSAGESACRSCGSRSALVERRDGERAEQAAAVVEHQLEIDLRAVGLLARGAGRVDDEAVHHVALVEQAGEARVLARSRATRSGRGSGHQPASSWA